MERSTRGADWGLEKLALFFKIEKNVQITAVRRKFCGNWLGNWKTTSIYDVIRDQ